MLRHLASLRPEDFAINSGLTVAIVAAAWALTYGLRRLVRRGVADLPSAPVARSVTSSRAFKLGMGLVKAAFIVGGAWLSLNVWGLDPAALLRGDGVGTMLRFAARLLLLLVIAVAVYEAAGFVVDRGMDRLASGAHEPRRAAQIQTLAPLLRGVLRGAIVVIAAMMLLSEIGVKIGPLLAGAGVVGVALGFGAQTLVKDFLTGFFFIIEDIVSVGDRVQIGAFSGLVETMTLRTIRLRDFDGTLHVFPYSEAQVIHNATKNFSYAVADIVITHESDVDLALEIIASAGKALAEDPKFAMKVLGPIDVLGVVSMSEEGVRLKARIKTPANEDSVVQRSLIRRIKTGFDAAGVSAASRQYRLVLPEPPDRPAVASH